MFIVSNLVCHIGRPGSAGGIREILRKTAARARGAYPRYMYTTGYFKRRVILKQQFTVKKGYYDPLYNTPYSEPDGLRTSIIAHGSSTAQNY